MLHDTLQVNSLREVHEVLDSSLRNLILDPVRVAHLCTDTLRIRSPISRRVRLRVRFGTDSAMTHYASQRLP